MSQVYLTSIELEQFRSFAKLKVDIAAEPSVLIVYGSNGLGKSSLFDALEWNLTDNIDHFRPANGYEKVGGYLCRWRNDPSATKVALSFSDGNLLERQLASPRATTSTLNGTLKTSEEITAFLKAPDWTPTIRALNRYLLLTHFLGQSTISRLTHKTDDERFEILKEAAQSAELEEFGISLHGKGSNKAAKAFDKRIEALEGDVTDLSDLLEQEDQLFQGVRASGAIDEDGVRKLTAQIMDLVRTATSTVGVPFDLVKDDTPQTAIDRLKESARERHLTISQARLLVDEQQRNNLRLAEDQAARAAALIDLSSATAAAAQVGATATARRAQATAELDKLSKAKAAHAQLVELENALASLARIAVARHKASTELAEAEKSLTSAEVEVENIERRRQILARLGMEIDAIDSEIAAVHDQTKRVAEWLERAQSLKLLETDLNELIEANPGLDTLISTTEVAAREAGEAAEAQARILTEMRASVGALTAAVSTIATNLHGDVCECPVCSTRFATPDALQQQVLQAADRLAPLLITQQQAYEFIQEAADNASARFVATKDMQAKIREVAELIAREQASNDRLLERLAWTGTAGLSSITAYQTLVREGGEKLQQRRQRRLRWVRNLGGETATIGMVDAMRRRDDSVRRRDALIRQVADFAVAAQQTSANISSQALSTFPTETLPPTVERVTASLIEAADRLDHAQEDADRAQLVAAEIEAQSSAAQVSVASATARIQELTQQLGEAAGEAQRIEQRWRELGWLAAGPKVGDLEFAGQRLAEAESTLDRAGTLLQRLRDGSEAFARQQAHRTSFERLRLATDLAPNSERKQIRDAAQGNLRDKQAELNATRAAKEKAGAASADIAREVEEFNAEYIQPLDALMKTINRAILCDPRVGIDLHLKRKKIAQTAARDGELPLGGALDPRLVHSEGQMAALAVSMLCAASLTYPWSRWRALILDDPLQHNDAIHAAAFADFIGNMVQQKSYQIFVSTHDLGQAEFLQRKFDARGIPCSTLSLLGRGKDGVEWSFKPRKDNSGGTRRQIS